MISLAIIPVAVVLVLLGLWLTRRPQTSDAQRIAGTALISSSAETFYLDYIGRQNLYQRGGAVVFVVASVLLSWRTSQSVVLWGATIDQTAGLAGVIVFAAVLGLIVGGLLAETYRLRPPPGERRASLDARDPRPVMPIARWAWAITALALVAAVIATATTGRASLAVGLVPGLLAIGLAEAVQARLHGRRRPVLTDEAMAADRALRAAVSQSITWLELAAALLTIGWVGMTFSAQQTPAAGTWPDAAWQVVALVSFLAVVPALICVHRGALARGGPKVQRPLA